jgi:Right handed beta helix region
MPTFSARASSPGRGRMPMLGLARWTRIVVVLAGIVVAATILWSFLGKGARAPGPVVGGPETPPGDAEEEAALGEVPHAAGGESYGVTRRSCAGVDVRPGRSIQAAIDAHPAGTTFCLKGIHRLRVPLLPKDDQRFVGARAAVLSGARVISSFEKRGAYWVATGQTQESVPVGFCLPASYDGCGYAEGVFIDDRNLRQVTTLGALSSGKFYFDYAADEIYLADNPKGRRVEASTATTAFEASSARGVEIRNIVVEKFANPAQSPALQLGVAWIAIRNEIRLNHGVGLASGSNSVIRRNDVNHQGQLGLSGYGASGALVVRNEVAYNNTEGFDTNWEAGGSKWVNTRNLTVRGNFVHDNVGNGLWTDIDNIGTTYERNRVVHNTGVGILHEISYDAVIRDNRVARNGIVNTWVDGAGIMVAHSPNVKVYRNWVFENGDGIVLKQSDRGSGLYGPYIVRNAFVHHNEVTMCEGITGAARTGDTDELIYDRNNRFEDNAYFVDSLRAARWMWHDVAITKAVWRLQGNDRTGSFATAVCP